MLETVFLYIFLHDDNSNGERFRTRMPDMKTCLEAVKTAKMPVPHRAGDSYEVLGVMWCGGTMEKYSADGIWHSDKTE